MYVNGKKIPVESIPGMCGRVDKTQCEFKYDIFDML
jgi:hypothetical protein